jgi:hypothetical protein
MDERTSGQEANRDDGPREVIVRGVASGFTQEITTSGCGSC